MVMVTRSTHRKVSDSSSDTSQKNVPPPWCYSGRHIEKRRKHRELTTETRSSYPLRENICEYLHADKELHKFACIKGKTAKNYSKQLQYKHKSRERNFLKLLILFLSAFGCTSLTFWKYNAFSSEELIAKFISKLSIITFLREDHSTSFDAECCHRMRHLAAELSRAQQALRTRLRQQRTSMFTSYSLIPEFSDDNRVMQRGYVDGARASKGSDTREWGSRGALWGIVPLWRASPPPDTVLALRTPTPSDCWPFSGSYGEVIIELAYEARPNYISVEHVRPDTARSAPRNFAVYSILENSTRVETARATYVYNKPAKQYFALDHKNLSVKQVVFRVLSNQDTVDSNSSLHSIVVKFEISTAQTVPLWDANINWFNVSAMSVAEFSGVVELEFMPSSMSCIKLPLVLYSTENS